MCSSSVLVRVLQRSKTNSMYLDLYLYINIAIDRELKTQEDPILHFKAEGLLLAEFCPAVGKSVFYSIQSVLQLIEESPSAMEGNLLYLKCTAWDVLISFQSRFSVSAA